MIVWTLVKRFCTTPRSWLEIWRSSIDASGRLVGAAKTPPKKAEQARMEVNEIFMLMVVVWLVERVGKIVVLKCLLLRCCDEML